MLYDHHSCSESAVTSQPIFMALNHVKLDKQSTRKYLYSLVWQRAHAHDCGRLSGMGEEIGMWVSEPGGSCQAERWVSWYSQQGGRVPGPTKLPAPAGTSQRGIWCSSELHEEEWPIRRVMLAAWLDVGRVCCRTRNDRKQLQQGSRKWSLDFRNTAAYQVQDSAA